VSSIAGPEGLIATDSAESMVVASSCAAAHNGAIIGIDEFILSAILVPPPAMALMIGSSIQSE
jgi:hypothetical protein